jgi:hypothetical protein
VYRHDGVADPDEVGKLRSDASANTWHVQFKYALNDLRTLIRDWVVYLDGLRLIVNGTKHKSVESNTKMTVEMRIAPDNWSQNGSESLPLRVVTASALWPGAGFDAGSGWTIAWQPIDIIRQTGGIDADCLLLESGDLAAFSVDDVERIGLPLVLALPVGADAASALPAGAPAGSALLADRAEGFVFADDYAATMAGVLPGRWRESAASRCATCRTERRVRSMPCRRRQGVLPTRWPGWRRRSAATPAPNSRWMRRLCAGCCGPAATVIVTFPAKSSPIRRGTCCST